MNIQEFNKKIQSHVDAATAGKNVPFPVRASVSACDGGGSVRFGNWAYFNIGACQGFSSEFDIEFVALQINWVVDHVEKICNEHPKWKGSAGSAFGASEARKAGKEFFKEFFPEYEGDRCSFWTAVCVGVTYG